jgi:hypothetical protein
VESTSEGKEMRKYQDKLNQDIYDKLLSLGTPEALLAHHIGGAIKDAFTCGYNGLRLPPRFNSPRTSAWVAYYAGKDAGKNKPRTQQKA